MRRQIEGELDRLFAYALSLSGEGEIAEELVQETVLRALAAKRAPNDGAGLRPWLFRILRNAFIDLLRRQGRIQYLDHQDLEAEIDEHSPAVQSSEGLVDEITVRWALAELPPTHREILSLIDVQGFSYAEAAEILETPVGTVMSRISRARQALLKAVASSNVTPLRRTKMQGA